jgi:phage regulator Rha-like protein
MNKTNPSMAIPDEIVMRKIFLIRGQKVMLDRDLAELYGVETKRLKEAVRRNVERFPEDFMFELTKREFSNWRTQFATSNSERMGLRIPPFAFTEYGILMLASVLNSKRAIQINIQVVRIFSKLRDMMQNQHVLITRIEQIEHEISGHDEKLLLIFEYLKQLEQSKQEEQEFKNRKPVGFKSGNKDNK